MFGGGDDKMFFIHMFIKYCVFISNIKFSVTDLPSCGSVPESRIYILKFLKKKQNI